ncbi:MAG: hypothetical protein DWQ02_13335 [Bacteroidetes bacterium]|nr:MAG: hypothetical protein DWQ02_13335 [Bacteroidota bacterium]
MKTVLFPNRILSILFVLLPVLLIGQNRFSWENEFTKIVHYPIIDFIELNGSIYAVFKNNFGFSEITVNNSVVIRKIGMDLEIEKEEKQKLHHGKKPMGIQKLFSYNNDLFILGKVGTGKLKEQWFVVMEMDTSELTLGKKRFEFFTDKDIPQFFFPVQDGSTETGKNDGFVFVSKFIERGDSIVSMDIFYLDEAFENEKKFNVSLDLKGQEFDIKKVYFDGVDQIFLSGYERPKIRKASLFRTSNKISNGHFWSINIKSGEVNHTVLQLDDFDQGEERKYIRDFDFMVKEGWVYIFGIYSETEWKPMEYSQSGKGLFFQKISQLDHKIQNFFYPIEDEVIKDHNETNEERKVRREIPDLEINDLKINEIVEFESNGFLIFTEVGYERVSSSGGRYTGPNSRSTPTSAYESHYSVSKDLIVFHLDKSGEQIWQSHIAKRDQSEVNYFPPAGSYFYFMGENQIQVFFMAPDFAFKNSEYSIAKIKPIKWNSYYNMVLCQASMNLQNGNTEYNIINTTSGTKTMILSPKVTKKISSNRYIVLGRMRAKAKFGIIEIE